MVLGIIISLQTWMLIEIVNLKVAVAKLSGHLNYEIATNYEKPVLSSN